MGSSHSQQTQSSIADAPLSLTVGENGGSSTTITASTADHRSSGRHNSRVKDRVLRHFYKKSASQQHQLEQQNFSSCLLPTVDAAAASNENGTKRRVQTPHRRQSDGSATNGSCLSHMNYSDTDGSLNAFECTPSADFDWSSIEFEKMHKTGDSSDTLASIVRDVVLPNESRHNENDKLISKTVAQHLPETFMCSKTIESKQNRDHDVIGISNADSGFSPKNSTLLERRKNFLMQQSAATTNMSLNYTHSNCEDHKVNTICLTGINAYDFLENIMDEIDLQQKHVQNYVANNRSGSDRKFTEPKKYCRTESNNILQLSDHLTTMPETKFTDDGIDVSVKTNNITNTIALHVNMGAVVDRQNVNSYTTTSSKTYETSIQNVAKHLESNKHFSDILRSVDDGLLDKCELEEKSEIGFGQNIKLNLNLPLDREQIELLLKTIEENQNNLNASENIISVQSDSWQLSKLFESIKVQQQQHQQQNSFTDDQIDCVRNRAIQLRESSTESESIFTDPITSPSCATDNETTFKSIENYSDSLNDLSQFSIRSTPYQHRYKFGTRKSSVLDQLSRSEIVYLSIDCSHSKSSSESPEDDLQMAIHLRNKLAQMLSNEEQKPRVDASTSPGIFNVARAKKVELQNLSSRLADNNLAGISPKIHDVHQSTSTQSYPETETECNQTLSPSCFGSFGDSNVLKKVASFITAEKSGNNEVTPRKSSLIPEKLNFSAYEKFEGQMLVKWITNSLISTGCNLSEQTLNILTQQYCANLLSIGVIKPICEKTDKNDIFNPYQMYQWAHRESISTSNPVTPGRLDAEIIWPHSSTPTSSLRVPRSMHVDIPTSDIAQLNQFNNNNNNNNNLNSNNNNNSNGNINNGNINTHNNNNTISKDLKVLSNGNTTSSISSTNLDNGSKRFLCGDRKVFELKKSLLNCNTLSEVYEVVETLLPDRKPSSSIIVSLQSPHRSPSNILNETEETLFGSSPVNVEASSLNTILSDEKPASIQTLNASVADAEHLDTTEENTDPSILGNLCCKCGKDISEGHQENSEDADSKVVTNENVEVPLRIDKSLQTSFDYNVLVKNLEEEEKFEPVETIDAAPTTPTNKEFVEAVNDCIKTSTPTESEPITEDELKISQVECGLPPPPPPPIPPPAPPLPPSSLALSSKIPPPPPALPNFTNLRSVSNSSSTNPSATNPSGSIRSPPNLQKTISTSSSTSPPSPAPFPMPPSSGSWFQTNNTLRKNAVNPPKPMKPLYWTRIVTAKPFSFGHSSEEKTDSSPEEETKEDKPKELWQEIDETSLDNFVIDEFTDLFSRQAIVPQNKPTRVKSNLARTIKILDSKRSQTVGIFYRSLHFDLEEIEHAIYHCDTSVVSLEILHHIMDIKATSEELAMIKEAAVGDIPLDAPEQFLLRISQISSSAERISCLVFQAEFDEGSTLVSRKLEVVKRLSEFLTDSDDLKLLFSIILTLGNYMNGGNRARGQADGFGLEILGKLKDVKSKDSKVTLLHFIVKTYIGRKRKSGTPLVEIALPIPEPSDVERAAAVDFDEVKQQILDLQMKLRVCQNTTEKVISSSNEENIQPFKNKMEEFIEMGDKKIENKYTKLEECRESFVKTMNFYHFIPKLGELQMCTPAQFFEYWTNFSNDFKDIWKKEITMLTNELIKKVKSQQKVQNTQSATSSTRPKLKPGGLKDRLQRMAKK